MPWVDARQYTAYAVRANQAGHVPRAGGEVEGSAGMSIMRGSDPGDVRTAPRWPARKQPAEYPPPNAAERVLAATAHLLIFFSLPGLAVAAVLWFLLRRWSPFISQQARQAVLWQTRTTLIVSLAVAVLLGVAFTELGNAINATHSTGSQAIPILFLALFGIVILLLGGMFIALGAALIGALYSLLGKPFVYPTLRKPKQRPS